jgi:hypothetical protein
MVEGMHEPDGGLDRGPDGPSSPDEPDDPDDPDDEGDGGPPSALEELEQGRVDPRLLQPDPGESREAFEARLLTTLLGLDEPDGGGGGGAVEVDDDAGGPAPTPPQEGLGPDGLAGDETA